MNPAPPETTALALLLLPAADTPIRKAEVAHRLGVVDVATVDHHRPAHQLLDAIQVKVTKLIPLRDEDEGVSSDRDFVRVLHVFDVRHQESGPLRRRRVVRAYGCAG